jgi:outer membrane protein assembly factor BamB
MNRPAVVAALLGAALLSQGQTAVVPADWPQWRGPRRDGSVTTALPASWPVALMKRWELVVGEGHSSPVISGNRVVVFTRQGDREVTRALDLATGKELWRQEYVAP